MSRRSARKALYKTVHLVTHAAIEYGRELERERIKDDLAALLDCPFNGQPDHDCDHQFTAYMSTLYAVIDEDPLNPVMLLGDEDES